MAPPKVRNMLCCFSVECGEPLGKVPEEVVPLWNKMLPDMSVVCAASGDDFKEHSSGLSLHFTSNQT